MTSRVGTGVQRHGWGSRNLPVGTAPERLDVTWSSSGSRASLSFAGRVVRRDDFDVAGRPLRTELREEGGHSLALLYRRDRTGRLREIRSEKHLGPRPRAGPGAQGAVTPVAVAVIAQSTAERFEAELMLGGLYLSYGQHRLAGEIFERVLAQSVDPSLHDRAWFFLAKIWHQRGYLAECEAALTRIGTELPEELEPERQMLYAQVLMDQGRFAEALTALESWRRPSDAWIGYAKFNIGVSLVRIGQIEAGAKVLDEVGRLELDLSGTVR